MKWIKKNGHEIETNNLPETEKTALSFGWKKKEHKKREAKVIKNSEDKE